jgi:hypothetical protein
MKYVREKKVKNHAMHDNFEKLTHPPPLLANKEDGERKCALKTAPETEGKAPI